MTSLSPESYFKLALEQFNNRHSQKTDAEYKRCCFQAIEYFEKAIEVEFEWHLAAESYYYCGLIYQILEDTKNAIKNYNDAIELNPKKYDAYINLGNCYQILEDHKSAVKVYTIALELKQDKLKSDDAIILNNRGSSLEQLQESEAAELDYCEAIALNPNEPTFYCNRGSLYQKRKLFVEAINDFTKAIALYQKRINSYNSLVLSCSKHIRQLYSSNKKMEEDKTDLFITQEFKKNNHSEINLPEDVLQSIQTLNNKAIWAKEKVSENKDLLALVYFKRSVVHHLLNNQNAATKDFKSAIALDPTLENAAIYSVPNCAFFSSNKQSAPIVVSADLSKGTKRSHEELEISHVTKKMLI